MNEVYIGRGREGINITWTPTRMRLDISGWYDSCVGIQGESMTLAEFFKRLGITEAHCAKAFKQMKLEE